MSARAFHIGDVTAPIGQSGAQALARGNLPIFSVKAALDGVERKRKLIHSVSFARFWIGSVDNRSNEITIVKIFNRLIKKTYSTSFHQPPIFVADRNKAQSTVARNNRSDFDKFGVV